MIGQLGLFVFLILVEIIIIKDPTLNYKSYTVDIHGQAAVSSINSVLAEANGNTISSADHTEIHYIDKKYSDA